MSSAGVTNQHESSSNSGKAPEVVEEQSETDAMALGVGATAGAILVGGAAAVVGAPFVLAGAALGALAGGIAGGAMGSEVTRGVELDEVMDVPLQDHHHKHHLGKPHLPHFGHHSANTTSSAAATDAMAGAQQVPGASQPPHPDELQRQDQMVAPEKDVAAAQAVAETASEGASSARDVSGSSPGKIYDIGGHPSHMM